MLFITGFSYTPSYSYYSSMLKVNQHENLEKFYMQLENHPQYYLIHTPGALFSVLSYINLI